jgi:cytochrome P450
VESVETRSAADAVDLKTADFFTDTKLVSDPYPYFDALRSRCPVHPVAHPGVVAVTGYDEAVQVYKDASTFSSCNSVGGPYPPLEVPASAQDVTDVIEARREQWPMNEFMVTMDGAAHESQRGLLRRLLTPRRLKENEAALAGIADRCIDEFISIGRCEVINDFGKPFTTLAIADLLGVPEEDHDEVRQVLAGSTIAVVGDEQTLAVNPLEFLFDKFRTYLEDRRRDPGDDVLTQLATATYDDGSLPEFDAIVRTAVFLFGAGQDTSARMLCAAIRIIADNKDIQERLRSERGLIPEFIEEVPAPGKPDDERLPDGSGSHHPWRGGHLGRNYRDDPPRCRQPRRASLPTGQRVPAGTHERSRTHRVRSCPGGPLATNPAPMCRTYSPSGLRVLSRDLLIVLMVTSSRAIWLLNDRGQQLRKWSGGDADGAVVDPVGDHQGVGVNERAARVDDVGHVAVLFVAGGAEQWAP